MCPHRCLILLYMPLLAGLSAGQAFADEKPLWELGIGMSALSFPDYRGSDQSSFFPIPFPYVVYRGTFLKADEDGIRGAFFNSDRIELNAGLGPQYATADRPAFSGPRVQTPG